MSPLSGKLEEIAEKWMVELLGLSEGTAMGLPTGSANAIICGLATGRNALLKRQGYDISKCGLCGAPRIKVVIGAGAHTTVNAALSLLGIGTDDIVEAPIDEYGRIKIDTLPKIDSNTLVVLQAGHVNGGAYDPINEIFDIAAASNAWVHVDGAFGLWAAASRNQKHYLKGIEKADSCSCDAHKTLNSGYDCGMIFCKDRNALAEALQSNAAYITYSESRDGMLYVSEMSRRARGITLWAALKQLGKSGLEAMLDGMCDCAEYFADKLQQLGYEVINPVFFNQFMVKCDTDEKTDAVLKRIQSSGTCWCSGSAWNGEKIIRISVCSYKTTRSDIDISCEAFEEAIKAL